MLWRLLLLMLLLFLLLLLMLLLSLSSFLGSDGRTREDRDTLPIGLYNTFCTPNIALIGMAVASRTCMRYNSGGGGLFLLMNFQGNPRFLQFPASLPSEIETKD